MNRRDFVRLGCATVIAAGAGKLRPALAQSLALRQVPGPLHASDDGDVGTEGHRAARRISPCESHR